MAHLTAPAGRKLQAVNWCRGYAGTALGGTAQAFTNHYTRQRVLPTASPMTGSSRYPVRRSSSISSSALWNTGSSAFADDDGIGCGQRLPLRAQRVGILDHIRAAAGGGPG